MNTNQKGFANIILIMVIIILTGAAGYFISVKKSEPAEQQIAPTPTIARTEILTPTSMPTGTERVSGIIKSAYSKSGKNYIDIDYICLTTIGC